MHRNARGLAEELVVGGLVGVLKPSPSADVVHQYYLELRCSGDHVFQQLPKARSILQD